MLQHPNVLRLEILVSRAWWSLIISHVISPDVAPSSGFNVGKDTETIIFIASPAVCGDTSDFLIGIHVRNYMTIN